MIYKILGQTPDRYRPDSVKGTKKEVKYPLFLRSFNRNTKESSTLLRGIYRVTFTHIEIRVES